MLKVLPSLLHMETGDLIFLVVQNQGAASMLHSAHIWIHPATLPPPDSSSHHHDFPSFPPQTLCVPLPAYFAADFYISPFTAKTEI